MDRMDKKVAIDMVAILIAVVIAALTVLATMWLTTHVGLLHAPVPQIRQIMGTPLTGSRVSPPTPVHDVYALDVVGRDGVQTIMLEVEVPWSTHYDGPLMPGWYRVPLTVILPGALP